MRTFPLLLLLSALAFISSVHAVTTSTISLNLTGNDVWTYVNISGTATDSIGLTAYNVTLNGTRICTGSLSGTSSYWSCNWWVSNCGDKYILINISSATSDGANSTVWNNSQCQTRNAWNVTNTDASDGVTSWTNPEYANISDELTATFAGATPVRNSEYLNATNFSFSISAGLTISGIKAKVETNKSSGIILDSVYAVYLQKSYSITGNNLSLGGAFTTAKQNRTFGGYNNLWGATWSSAQVNDVGFGFTYQIKAAEANHYVYVDSMELAVFWNVTTIDATLPSVNITLNNSVPKTGNVLNISATVNDDTGLSSCWLYNNLSNTNTSAKILSGIQDTCSFNYTIGAAKSTVINFTLYANDTSGNVAQNSSKATIANSPPAPFWVQLTQGAKKTETLNASGFASDADSDSMTHYFAYANSTATLQNGTISSLNCSSFAGCVHFATLTVYFWAGDGTDNSSYVSNTTNILNTLPSGTLSASVGNGSTFYDSNATMSLSGLTDADSDLIYCEFWDENGLEQNDSSCTYTTRWKSGYGNYAVNINITDGYNYSHYAYYTFSLAATPIESAEPAGGGNYHSVPFSIKSENVTLLSSKYSIANNPCSIRGEIVGNYVVTEKTTGQQACVQCSGDLLTDNETGIYYCKSCPYGIYDEKKQQCVLNQNKASLFLDRFGAKVSPNNPILGAFLLIIGATVLGVMAHDFFYTKRRSKYG